MLPELDGLLEDPLLPLEDDGDDEDDDGEDVEPLEALPLFLPY